MDTLDSQIILDDHLIHPKTKAENVIYSDTTLKNAFDNYSPITMSNFGKKIIKCNNLADLSRLAKDNIDYVIWSVNGYPSVDNLKLHCSENNYIYRNFTLGAADLTCEFDLSCSDPNKIVFHFDNNQAAVSTANVYRYWIRLATNADGILCAQYISRFCNKGAWANPVINQDVEIGDCSTQTHIKIIYETADNKWAFYLNGSSKGLITYTMATRSWGVYLGYTADCIFDNFTLTYDSNIISQLDFNS